MSGGTSIGYLMVKRGCEDTSRSEAHSPFHLRRDDDKVVSKVTVSIIYLTGMRRLSRHAMITAHHIPER